MHAHTHCSRRGRRRRRRDGEGAAGAVVLMYTLPFDLHLIRAIMLVSCGGAARHKRVQTHNETP